MMRASRAISSSPGPRTAGQGGISGRHVFWRRWHLQGTTGPNSFLALAALPCYRGSFSTRQRGQHSTPLPRSRYLGHVIPSARASFPSSVIVTYVASCCLLGVRCPFPYAPFHGFRLPRPEKADIGSAWGYKSVLPPR